MGYQHKSRQLKSLSGALQDLLTPFSGTTTTKPTGTLPESDQSESSTGSGKGSGRSRVKGGSDG